MEMQSSYCSYCRRRTLHITFNDRRISKLKVIIAVLTYGLSILFLGLRKSRNKVKACQSCGQVKN